MECAIIRRLKVHDRMVTPMDILTIASQKGGAGKTTLAAHLAVEAEHTGAGPVAIVDTDPQGSLADWWNQRTAEMPAFAAVEIDRLAAHMAALRRQRITLVITDTPPALLETIRAAIAVATLVLIPARPSPHYLRAVGVIVEMAEQASKPFCFVVNGAASRSLIAIEARDALAQHGPVASVMLHQRIDFATSMIDGRTVGELNPQSRSAQELTQLWDYVKGKLRKEKGL
jgi:chromosome partitioning protein